MDWDDDEFDSVLDEYSQLTKPQVKSIQSPLSPTSYKIRKVNYVRKMTDQVSSKFAYFTAIACFVIIYVHFSFFKSLLGFGGDLGPSIFCRVGDFIETYRHEKYEEAVILSQNPLNDTMTVQWISDQEKEVVSTINMKKGSSPCQPNWPACQQTDNGKQGWATKLDDFRGPLIDVTQMNRTILSAPLDKKKCREENCYSTDKFGCEEAVECSSVCAHVPSCKYWSWGYEKEGNVCWLLTHEPTSRPEGFIGGSVQCNPGVWLVPGFQASLGREASDKTRIIKRLQHVPLTECADQCRLDQHCAVFEWMSPDQLNENCRILRAGDESNAGSWFGKTNFATGWAMFQRLPHAVALPGITLVGRDEGEGHFVDWRANTPLRVDGQNKPSSLNFMNYFSSANQENEPPVTFEQCQQVCMHHACKAGLWLQNIADVKKNQWNADVIKAESLGHCLMSDEVSNTPRPCPNGSRCLSFRAAVLQDVLSELEEMKHKLASCRGSILQSKDSNKINSPWDPLGPYQDLDTRPYPKPKDEIENYGHGESTDPPKVNMLNPPPGPPN